MPVCCILHRKGLKLMVMVVIDVHTTSNVHALLTSCEYFIYKVFELPLIYFDELGGQLKTTFRL